MDKNVFTDNMNYIRALETSASRYEADLEKQVSYLKPLLDNLLKSIKLRNSSLLGYLDNLEDFNFSEDLTTPSNLFPGIRVALNNDKIEDVKVKSDEMKSQANQVELATKNIDVQSRELLQHLKSSISLLSEYMLQENQLYDTEIKLTQDLDSIYDIGQLSTSTK